MAEQQRTRLQRLSLEDFKARKETPAIEALMGQLNGGTFMECHQRIFEQTGIWVPELVPVFQKLDAMLVFRQLPAELRG